ncbi:hypothetical protein IMAU10149_00710 [Lactobacillus helveticus]|uniref:hypothetical protein n=1 Tax=Lactobacillus helveticus TaxID=1587 RepID=UPI0015678704|nr:hypothetical protein [Lactobacillus helveticus]NRO84138.1 hypothetical protein [Lactobacillus helveticus]
MDKEWLEASINGQAQINFESKFENIPFNNEKIHQAYQAIQKTDEWKNFKKLMIESYANNITQNARWFSSEKGLKAIIRDAGRDAGEE